MERIKTPLPKFETEEEEAEYWDKHSILEHFDESDFKPLQVKRINPPENNRVIKQRDLLDDKRRS